jgi:hypothetical protein
MTQSARWARATIPGMSKAKTTPSRRLGTMHEGSRLRAEAGTGPGDSATRLGYTLSMTSRPSLAAAHKAPLGLRDLPTWSIR